MKCMAYVNIHFLIFPTDCMILRAILEEIKLVLQCKKNSGSLKGEKNFCEKCTQTLSIGTYWSLLSPSNSINPMETENFEDEKRKTRFASLENKNTFYIFCTFLDFIRPLTPTCQVANYALDWCLARFQNCANVRLRWSGQKCKQTSSHAARSKRFKISNCDMLLFLPGTRRSLNISVSWID